MKFCPVVPEICRGQVHGPNSKSARDMREICSFLKESFEINKFDSVSAGPT
jgi:hypothetical protein